MSTGADPNRNSILNRRMVLARFARLGLDPGHNHKDHEDILRQAWRLNPKVEFRSGLNFKPFKTKKSLMECFAVLLNENKSDYGVKTKAAELWMAAADCVFEKRVPPKIEAIEVEGYFSNGNGHADPDELVQLWGSNLPNELKSRLTRALVLGENQ